MIEAGTGGRYFDTGRGVPSYLLKPQHEDSSESESSHPRKPRPPSSEPPSAARDVAARLDIYYHFCFHDDDCLLIEFSMHLRI